MRSDTAKPRPRAASRRASRRIYPILLGVALAASGCITTKPVSRAASPQAHVIPNVPVRTFGIQRCGAGSLSAVLAAHGLDVDLDTLHAELPKGRNQGVITLDLVLAARERGFDARLVEGTPEIVRAELEHGRPVILMLKVIDSLGEWRDLFHYVVVDGYDPVKDLIRVQWGDAEARWTTFDRLESAWAKGDHATILVAPPDAAAPGLPTAAQPAERRQRMLAFAVALEAEGRPGEAATLYRRLLADAPGTPAEEALLWTNLANASAAAGETAEARSAYRHALELDPTARDAWNNLAWLLFEAGTELDEAEEAARIAVAFAGPDPHLALDTLGRVLAARGACEEAVDAFAHALEALPAASDRRASLELARGLAERDCGRSEAARASLGRALVGSSDEAVRDEARRALRELAAGSSP